MIFSKDMKEGMGEKPLFQTVFQNVILHNIAQKSGMAA